MPFADEMNVTCEADSNSPANEKLNSALPETAKMAAIQRVVERVGETAPGALRGLAPPPLVMVDVLSTIITASVLVTMLAVIIIAAMAAEVEQQRLNVVEDREGAAPAPGESLGG
ncbi:Protein of unknown function [Gryllus bimaculatus]|nr:Protein of unknown function [Gryllus bimaculatus]